MRATPAVLAALVWAIGFARPASADVFKMKDGRVWEGEVASENPGTVRIKTSIGGFVDLVRADIAAWEKLPPLRDLYRDKKRAIQPPSAKAFYDLGLWARENRLSAEAREAFEIAISLDPEHALARIALGYERVDGKWLSRDDRLRAKGYVEFRGRWIPEAERDRLAAAERRDEVARLLERHDRAPEGARAEAAAAIRALKDPGVEDVLLERYGRSSPATRSIVVEVLGALKTAAALDGLLRIALRDPDALIRSSAAAALQLAGPGGGLDGAILALERSTFPVERARAAEILGALGDLRAVLPLIRALYIRRVYEEEPPPGNVTVGVPVVIGKRVKVAKNVVAEEPVVGYAGTPFPPEDAPSRLPSYEVCPEAREALKRLTGVDHGYRKDSWLSWWEKEGPKRLAPPTENPK